MEKENEFDCIILDQKDMKEEEEEIDIVTIEQSNQLNDFKDDLLYLPTHISQDSETLVAYEQRKRNGLIAEEKAKEEKEKEKDQANNPNQTNDLSKSKPSTPNSTTPSTANNLQLNKRKSTEFNDSQIKKKR